MLVALTLGSFLASLAAIGVLLSHFRWLAPDRPNERSLHERPVPRTPRRLSASMLARKLMPMSTSSDGSPKDEVTFVHFLVLQSSML
jgi:hypothetical protein